MVKKIEAVEKRGVVSAGVALRGDLGYVFWGAHGRRMNWARTRTNRQVSLPNVWPAPDLQVDFGELVSISLQ
jgi:hypothetical protein